jgi:Protein of unknown function (DUF3592)
MKSRKKNYMYSAVLFLVSIILLLSISNKIIMLFRLQFAFKENTAVVLNVSVVETEQMTDSEFGGSEIAYIPQISYEYAVENVKYSNNRYSITKTGGKKEWASNIVAEYSKGSQIPIFYDKNEPSYAVVTKSISETVIQRLAIAIGGSLICFVSSVIYFLRARNQT